MHEQSTSSDANSHSGSRGGAAHAEEHGQHGGIKKFVMVFLGLLGLTAVSFTVASSAIMETPAVGWTIMMAVSCAKAMLVISFFMHLIWEANWKYVLTIPASIMSIFLVLMLAPDVGLRTRKYSESRWLHSAEARESEEGVADEHEGEDVHGGAAAEEESLSAGAADGEQP